MFVNNSRDFSLLFGIALNLIAQVLSVSAQAAGQPTPVGYGMTSGRLVASLSALIGLIGAVIGALAVLRPGGRFGSQSGSLGAMIALAAGLIAIVVGGIKAATATGIGTGGGLVGAIFAVVLGLIAGALGSLALSRSRHAA
jgi:hypothetical protein